MPTVTVPSPLSAIHSWDSVYFRFSGMFTNAPLEHGRPIRVPHAPSVRLPEKLAAGCCRVFLRRGQRGLLSRAPEPRAVLLPESLRGLTPSALPSGNRGQSLPRAA